ncbi:MAG: PIF1 family DEAD/DEAH box helicase [Parcubacteria group bacterium]|jgi:ATP-dependent exoDNAse (exonuclease V) alpha subunit
MKQDLALNILKRGHNVFLTGPAGSGKTFLLNAYIGYLKQNRISYAVTASTGIAATHIGGRTIHSWSGIGIKEDLSEKEIKKIIRNPLVHKRLTKTDVLIIDEISMLHAYQIDLINKILRSARENVKSFGGMQIILSGDFFQLPPVRKNAGTTVQFIDQSQSWKEMDLKVCYLSEQYRQKEDALSRVLSDIRGKCVTEKTHLLLKKATNQKIDSAQERTKLFTHNIDVDRVNNHELHKIKEKSFLYRMVSDGNEKLVEAIKNGCLAPEELILKKGALVMFVRNNFDQGYVNGTIGTVIDFDEDRFPIVKTLHGEEIRVSPEKWLIEEDGEELAQIKQLPLRLAWAITIHKSQGMTLDAAEIDLKKCFEYGMGYVALSRVRTLRDITLLGINDIALQVDPTIFKKDHVFQNISATLEQEEMKKKKVLIHAKPDKKITSSSEKKSHQNSQNMYPHAGKPWKPEDDKRLLACIKKHQSIKTIAKIFGRQEGAIRSRIKKITPK